MREIKNDGKLICFTQWLEDTRPAGVVSSFLENCEMANQCWDNREQYITIAEMDELSPSEYSTKVFNWAHSLIYNHELEKIRDEWSAKLKHSPAGTTFTFNKAQRYEVEMSICISDNILLYARSKKEAEALAYKNIGMTELSCVEGLGYDNDDFDIIAKECE